MVKVVRCPPGNAANCEWWPQKISARYSTYHAQLQVHPYRSLQPEPIDPVLWRTAHHKNGDREEPMHESPSINLTTEPGVATVILGSGMELPDAYRQHPRVQTIDGTDLPPDPADILGLLPSQTRVVLVGGLLSRPVFAAFRTAMHRRRLVYVTRDSRAELKAAIDQVFPKTNAHEHEVEEAERAQAPAPTEEKRKRGRVKGQGQAGRSQLLDFVQAHLDPSRVTVIGGKALGALEEAKRLWPLTKREGLPTTMQSLANTIGRVVKQGPKPPKPPKPPTAPTAPTITPQSELYAMGDQAKVLQLVDDAIAAFQLIREYLQTTGPSAALVKEYDATIARYEQDLRAERTKSEALEKKVRALKEVFGNL